MTIAIEGNPTRYTGNGTDAVLSTRFKFFLGTDIVVTQRITATGVTATLVKDTHYTVSADTTLAAVGTVTVIDGETNFTSDMAWTLERSLPRTQGIDYQDNENFPGSSHETALDRLTLLVQDMQSEVGRCIKIPVGDPAGLTTDVPSSVGRADEALSFDANGNVLFPADLKYMNGGFKALFTDPGKETDHKVLPYACELKSVTMQLDLGVTTAHTAEVLVERVPIAPPVFINIPAMSVGTGVQIAIPDGAVVIQPGEVVSLQNDGGSSGDSSGVYLTYAFEALSPRPAGEVWLEAGVIPAIHDSFQITFRISMPFDCDVIGIALSTSAPTNAVITLGVIKNTQVDTGFDVILPNPTTTGFFEVSGGPAPLLIGEKVVALSDGGGSTGGQTTATWVVRQTGSQYPADWVFLDPEVPVVLSTGGVDIHNRRAVPVAGIVRDMAFHTEGTIQQATTYNLLINAGAVSGTPKHTIPIHAVAGGLASVVPLLPSSPEITVAVGDTIDADGQGEQVNPSSNFTYGVWIEPL